MARISLRALFQVRRCSKRARGLSDAGLPPEGLDSEGWRTFALRFKNQFANLRSKRTTCEDKQIKDDLSSLVLLRSVALSVQHRLDPRGDALNQLLDEARWERLCNGTQSLQVVFLGKEANQSSAKA